QPGAAPAVVAARRPRRLDAPRARRPPRRPHRPRRAGRPGRGRLDRGHPPPAPTRGLTPKRAERRTKNEERRPRGFWPAFPPLPGRKRRPERTGNEKG